MSRLSRTVVATLVAAVLGGVPVLAPGQARASMDNWPVAWRLGLAQAPTSSRPSAQLSAETLYERGSVRSSQGDNQGAIEDFSQALRLNPDYGDAYIGRGYARSN